MGHDIMYSSQDLIFALKYKKGAVNALHFS